MTVAAAIMFLFLCGLGTWQLQRMWWKEGLLAQVAAREHAAPRPLTAVLAEAAQGADVSYTRVRVSCAGLAGAPYLRLYALVEAKTGDRLISACRPTAPGAPVLLVDRGFLPDGAVGPRVDDRTTSPVAFIGVLRRPDPKSPFAPANSPQGRWFTRDLKAMAATLQASADTTYYVGAETAINPETPALIPAPMPPTISNRHLGYVITWYGLAAALVAVYAGLLRTRLKAAKSL
jgi:surfeit locus 1 family protein